MGFYGETRKNAAIPECISLDRKFRRRTSGTDVFIAAFSEGKNWQDDIIRSVLSEFLISVFQNDLVVSVGDTEISSETLPALVEKYREVIPEVFNYYQAMTSDKAVVISDDRAASSYSEGPAPQDTHEPQQRNEDIRPESYFWHYILRRSMYP